MADLLLAKAYSIGSSSVMMWPCSRRLIASIMPASVVLLPEPVGPVHRIRPRGRYVSLFTISGRNSCSIGRTLSFMGPIARGPVVRRELAVERERPRAGGLSE